MTPHARAVVFANHDVGVRCLSVLLRAGIEVPLVVAHQDHSVEALSFASVIEFAAAHQLKVATPGDAREAAFVKRIAGMAPDFIFSFYYRQLLGPAILESATRGALNMHGSLLPGYRGRAPVNWVVVRGESQTGATLHYMTEKADAGDIVDQEPVPIGPDETAFEVFRKVTAAAEVVMARSLPALLQGTAPRIPQDPARATYFGRRRPEDGLIDWSADASTIHNLVRGVAPPYPGAYTRVQGRKLCLLKTARERPHRFPGAPASMFFESGACFIACVGGDVLRVLECELDGQLLTPTALRAALRIGDSLELPTRQSESA